jgi:hypothetical protein
MHCMQGAKMCKSYSLHSLQKTKDAKRAMDAPTDPSTSRSPHHSPIVQLEPLIQFVMRRTFVRFPDRNATRTSSGCSLSCHGRDVTTVHPVCSSPSIPVIAPSRSVTSVASCLIWPFERPFRVILSISLQLTDPEAC